MCPTELASAAVSSVFPYSGVLLQGGMAIELLCFISPKGFFAQDT